MPDSRSPHPLAKAGGDIVSARAQLRARLEARLPELEAAILARLHGIDDASRADPAYARGLRESVSVALNYALGAIERGEERTPPPPPALLAQARMAARHGVGLDTVLRRYCAGYSLLGDFLADEAAQTGLADRLPLPELLRGRAAILDRLLAAVSEEYRREAETVAPSEDQRRGERVERLLAGEALDTSGLDYDFDAFHVGLVAEGEGAMGTLREVAKSASCRLMLVRRERDVWAWLGGRRRCDPAELGRRLRASIPRQMAIALGEPMRGPAGWRLTHRQAAAAMEVALRRSVRFVRYRDVALLAAAVRDELLASSLDQLFLAPLGAERDGGEVARQTLRAYFGSDRNVSSTAASLRVSRNAVTRRLRRIEESIGCALEACATELEVAVELAELRRLPHGRPTT